MVALLTIFVWPLAGWSIEKVPFSWNRGWPDGGRALASGLGASYLNSALVGNSRRYVGGIGGQAYPPNRDYRLSAGVADSQSDLAGEVVYEWERSIDGILPTGSSHRIQAALSERYTETLLVGFRGNMDWPDVKGRNPGKIWGYGFGLQKSLGNGIYLALASGDWFQKGKDPYLVPSASAGFGLVPATWFRFVLDTVFRWGQTRLDTIDRGSSVGLSSGIAFLVANRVAWRLGYHWDRRWQSQPQNANDHTVGTSIELPIFPWSIAIDGRWNNHNGWSTGLAVMRAFFYEE